MDKKGGELKRCVHHAEIRKQKSFIFKKCYMTNFIETKCLYELKKEPSAFQGAKYITGFDVRDLKHTLSLAWL